MKYMLLTFVRKPNGAIDEQCTIAQKLRKSDQSMCNIILNFAEQKIEKCVVEGKVLDTSWDRIVAYYRSVYPDLFTELYRANGLDSSSTTTSEITDKV